MAVERVPPEREIRVKLVIDSSEIVAALRRAADALEAPRPSLSGPLRTGERADEREAFISGTPDQRQRSLDIWQETERRLRHEDSGGQPS